MPFSEILGQDDAARSLQSAFRQDRVAGAYLFRGPEGVGKAKMAFEFAKLLACERPHHDACGRCPSCTFVAAGTYPDIHIIEPADGKRIITVDQVRAANEDVFLYPVMGKRKVFIIRDADDLREDAQNMMLKTLEEPPADSVLILLSARPHHLVPTIHSRCQTLRFRPLKQEHIAKILDATAADYEKPLRTFAAGYAAGSASEALRVLGADGLAVRDQLVRLIGDLRPGASFRAAGEIYEQIASAAKEKLLEDQRVAARFYLDMLARLYRDMVVLEARGSTVTLFNADRREPLEAMAAKIGLYTAAANAGILQQGRANIDRNANVRLALEDALALAARQQASGAA